MAREASPLTVAIRGLCDSTNFEITHKAARPLLIEAGHKLVADPNDKLDDDLNTFDAKFAEIADGFDYDPKNAAHIADLENKTAEALGWNERKLKAIRDEKNVREAFRKEKNAFDVVKYNYRTKKEGGTGSAKPASAPSEGRVTAAVTTAKKTGRKAVATVASAPKAKQSPVVGTDDMTAAIAAVKEFGGLAKAKEFAETLLKQCEMVESLKALVADAA